MFLYFVSRYFKDFDFGLTLLQERIKFHYQFRRYTTAIKVVIQVAVEFRINLKKS